MKILSYVPAGIIFILFVWQIVLQHKLDNEDAQKTKRKKRAKILLLVTLVVFIGGEFLGRYEDHVKERESERTITDLRLQITNLSLQITAENSTSRQELKQGFQGLSSVLETNQSLDRVTRQAILNTQEQKITEKRNMLNQQQELIAIEPISIHNLRIKRTNEAAMRQVENELTENKRRQAEIEQQRIQEQDKQAQELAQKKAQESALAKEKLVTDQCLSVFDDVLGSFYSILMSLAKDTGDRVFSDFSKNPPTTVQSSFYNGGKIVRGTNSLSLGTNSSWSFDIRTQVTSQSSLSNQRFASFSPVSLRISCKGKDGFLFLHVSPTISAARGEIVEDGINQVILRLKIANQAMTNGQYSLTNYSKALDEALRTLLSAQDEQFPLSTRTDR